MIRRVIGWVALLVVVSQITTCKARRHNPASGTAGIVGSPSAAVTEVLPPAGTRSLFDIIYHSEATPPKKFEDLLALIKKTYKGEWIGTLIPHGRSLAARETDFKNPRAVVQFHSLNMAPSTCGYPQRDKLFLGFAVTDPAKGTGVVEVISFNEKASRYEFQIIADFGKETQKLLYAPRAACTKCHQGGVPIFPFPEWQETNATQEREQIQNAEEVAERIQKENPGVTKIHGLPIAHGQSSAGAVDFAARRAALVENGQRLWEGMCSAAGPDEAKCKALALRVALKVMKLDQCQMTGISQEDELYKPLPRLWRKVFPPDGVIFYSSNIPDRLATRFSAFGTDEDPRKPRKPLTTILPNGPKDDGFKNDSPTSCIGTSMEWGKAPQIAILFASGSLGESLTADEKRLVKNLAAAADDARLQSAEKWSSLLAPGRLSKADWIQTLGDASSWSVSERAKWTTCFPVGEGLPEPEGFVGPLPGEGGTPHPKIQLYRKHCGSCHSNPTGPYPFLSDPDDQKLAHDLKLDQALDEVMGKKSIPPPEAGNYKFLFETEEGKREWKAMADLLSE